MYFEGLTRFGDEQCYFDPPNNNMRRRVTIDTGGSARAMDTVGDCGPSS
jgi:hypothetical protein